MTREIQTSSSSNDREGIENSDQYARYVDSAIAVIAELLKIDADEATQILHAYVRSQQCRLGDFAEYLVRRYRPWELRRHACERTAREHRPPSN